MSISSLVIGTWALTAAVVVGYPLLSGKIRRGSSSISRDDAPSEFWSAYVMSTGLFLAVSAALGWFVLPRLPG